MSSVATTFSNCPSCDTPLALFTPREALSHVNACLDTYAVRHSNAEDVPRCAVCNRDLTSMTVAARNDHANHCVDTLVPLPPPPASTRRPRNYSRNRSTTSGLSAAREVVRRPSSRSADAPQGDARVRHLLQMLGLERYATKFAQEEIDLVALRLLNGEDLAALSIPENARRRIAEAMHNVEILAELQRASRSLAATTAANRPNSPPQPPLQPSPQLPTNAQHKSREDQPAILASISDDDSPPQATAHTQPFATSRLRKRLGRKPASTPTSELPPSDDEVYFPTATQTKTKPPPSTKPPMAHSQTGPDSAEKPTPSEQDKSRCAFGSTGKADKFQLEKSTPDAGNIRHKYTMKPIRSSHKSSSSSSSSSSSFASDLSVLDLQRNAECLSQISMEQKLDKWLRRMRDREHRRHCEELKRINEMYEVATLRMKTRDRNSREEENNRMMADRKLGGVGEENSGEVDFDEDEDEDDDFKSADGEGVVDLTKIGNEGDERRCNGEVLLISSGSLLGGAGDGQEEEEAKTRPGTKSSFAVFGKAAPLPSPDERKGDGESEGSSSVAPIDFGELERQARAPSIDDLTEEVSRDAEGEAECEQADGDEEEGGGTQSRLKKRRRGRKVTREEIVRAIKEDGELYDEMLMMESVGFERVLEVVRRNGVKASKKCLHEFVVQEGVMFKSAVKPNEQSQKYMRTLNSDRRDPSV